MGLLSFHAFVFLIGVLSLFHAAYSAAQHRSYLRITKQEFYALPLDIITQGILSLFVAMYGILYIAGDFKEIRATKEMENKSWETFRNLPSFYSFNHRGKNIFPPDNIYGPLTSGTTAKITEFHSKTNQDYSYTFGKMSPPEGALMRLQDGINLN